MKDNKKSEVTSTDTAIRAPFKTRAKNFFRRHGFMMCGWAYIILMLVFTYLPIIVLMVYSFINTKTLGGEGDFTLSFYAQLFDLENSPEYLTAAGNSIIIAASSGLLATLIGTLAAVGIFYLTRFKKVVNAINQITVVNAEIVTAVAFMLFFVLLQTVNIGIPEGFPTLILSHTMITIPYVIMSVTPRLAQLDPNLFEAGLDLGASPMKSMFTVIVPQLLPAMLTGFALAFTLSMDDFVISKFNRGDIYTISTLIYDQMKKNGIKPPFRALSTIFFVVIITVLIAYNIIKNRKNKTQNTIKGE